MEEQKLDLYGPRPVTVPRPELYVVYTGDRQDVPGTLRLSQLWEGAGHVELEVKVLRGDAEESDDILRQYVRFCKIADQQRKVYGPTAEAVRETIRLCLEEKILVPLLTAREKEVSDIMVVLYDQEKVMEIHDYNVAKEAEKRGFERGAAKTAEKVEQAVEQTAEIGIRAAVRMMKNLNASQAAAVKELMAQYGILHEAAEEKVKLYWGQ